MKPALTQTRSLPAFSAARVGLVLWLVAVGYVAFVDPPARYAASAPPFFSGSAYLKPFLFRGGGFAEYAGNAVAQLDSSRWLGAVAFGALLAGIGVGTQAVLRGAGLRLGLGVVIPALWVGALYARYMPPASEIGLALFLVLVALAGWQRLRSPSAAARATVFACLAAFLFYLVGPLPSLCFGLTGAVVLLTETGGRRSALAAAALLLPWLLGLAAVGRSELAILTERWTTKGSGWLTVFTFAAVPLLLVLGHWLKRLKPVEVSEPVTRPKRAEPARKSAQVRRSDWRAPLQASLGLLLLLAGWLALDLDQRARLRIQSLAERGDWSGVLAAARRLDSLSPATRLQVNRALFHSGRLTDDLFSYPQRGGVDLLASLSDGLEVCLPMCDTLLELGQVNLAERFAHEALEVYGEKPALLWRLARINLLKERPQAARVFLNRLRVVPFHRAAAERWLAGLSRDPALDFDAELSRVRPLRVAVDHWERQFATETLLQDALQSNRTNRMAADYLLAHLLLTRNEEAIARNLSLAVVGSAGLPRHLAEALVSYQRSRQASEWRGPKPPEEMIQRFERFLNLAQRGNASAVTLASEFGDTYWHYASTGRSGAPRK